MICWDFQGYVGFNMTLFTLLHASAVLNLQIHLLHPKHFYTSMFSTWASLILTTNKPTQLLLYFLYRIINHIPTQKKRTAMGAAQRHVLKHAQYYYGFQKKTSQSDYYHHICVLNDPSCKKKSEQISAAVAHPASSHMQESWHHISICCCSSK